MPEDRDVLRLKHTAAPEPVFDDATGRCERGEIGSDERDVVRAKRSTADRLERLTTKHEALAKDVTETRVIVGRVEGRLDGQDKVLAQINAAVTEGRHLTVKTFEAQLDVGTAERKATLADELDAKKSRRKVWTRVLTAIAGVIGAFAAHWLLGRLGL